MLWELAGLKEQAPEADKRFSMLTPALKRKISKHKAQRTRRPLRKKKVSAKKKRR